MPIGGINVTGPCRTFSLLAFAAFTVATCGTGLAQVSAEHRPIRMGSRGSIIAVHPGTQPTETVATATAGAPFPEPRLAGFSPLVALTASDMRNNPNELNFEHTLLPSYTCHLGLPPPNNCSSLNPPVHSNFVVGIVDTGAVVDLIAGISPFILGVDGPFMTNNSIPIGGVGGTVDAFISQPIGLYAAGLQAVDSLGLLDPAALVGHGNTSIVVAPPIDCGTGEVVEGVIGTPFLAFYNTTIYVDRPRRIVVGGKLYKSPEVLLQQPFIFPPTFDRSIALEIGGLSPVTTASFFPDFEDLETPLTPTLLSLTPASFPTGGLFFVNVRLREGPAGDNNPIQVFRFMFDTGAQSSIISPAVAAELNLPITPDFTVDVCGVGGIETGTHAYYIDYVRLNALGGALEFSNAPFVVLDLPSVDFGALDGVLGMNFFWNRNIAVEPALSTSSFFHVSNPVPVARADFDADQLVDEFDHLTLAQCVTGPAPAATPFCKHTDIDANGRVDLGDFRWLQNCYSGSDEPADTACGP